MRFEGDTLSKMRESSLGPGDPPHTFLSIGFIFSSEKQDCFFSKDNRAFRAWVLIRKIVTRNHENSKEWSLIILLHKIKIQIHFIPKSVLPSNFPNKGKNRVIFAHRESVVIHGLVSPILEKSFMLHRGWKKTKQNSVRFLSL